MYIKLLLVLLAMGFFIFFGVDLATRGVERVQGPFVKTAADSEAMQFWPRTDKGKEVKAAAVQGKNGVKNGARADSAEGKGKKEAKEETIAKTEITETSGMARVGNKTGELLQIIAHHGIRLVVSLFEAVTS